MSMRISSAGILLLLAACSQGATEGTAAAADEDFDDRIACAVAGAATFARACQVERTEVDGAPILVVRHPDGRFRRFEVMSDGTGLAAADGAQRAQVSLGEDGIEVTVGNDRYRFPATIAGHDKR